MEHVSPETESTEERFMSLLKYSTIKQVKDFLTKNPPMDLHRPTVELKTPLTMAIDRGDLQILSILLDKHPTNLEESITQPWKRTALMYAALVSRSPEVLQLLLKKGADVKATDIGWSCLQYAVVGERYQNVEVLLDYACVDQRDVQERTPLMISVYLSNLDILSLLLSRGADINAHDKRGLTALQLTILWRKRDAAILLMEGGSDISVLTPLTKVSLGELCRTTMPNILRCIELKTRPDYRSCLT